MNLTDFMENRPKENNIAKNNSPKPKKRGKKIPEGERNSTLNRRAGQILKRYGDTAEARSRYDELCALCEPRLDSAEENTIFLSAQKFFHNTVEKSPTYIDPKNFETPPFVILT